MAEQHIHREGYPDAFAHDHEESDIYGLEGHDEDSPDGHTA